MKLLIISHTPHYQQGGQVLGWGATVREIDQLARLFDHVVHLAPLHPGSPPKSALPYQAGNVDFHPVKPAGGEGLKEKLAILTRIPGWVDAMRREMRQSDAIHIRCPAGISLVALLVTRLWGREKPIWVKYAGNWEPSEDPLTYRIQRILLEKNWHQGVVTVNGDWPDQPDHIFTFINPSFSMEEYENACQVGYQKALREHIQILFVGRVETEKGVGRVIQIANKLCTRALPFLFNIIGDGPERPNLESLVANYGLEHQIKFMGWQAKNDLNKYYQDAHFILHPSTASEGWPKVLSEAMAHGVVPIASTVASIPGILGRTGAGLALPPEDIDGYVDAILKYTQEESAWKQASLNGIIAARDFTYERYLVDVIKLFQDTWDMTLAYE